MSKTFFLGGAAALTLAFSGTLPGAAVAQTAAETRPARAPQARDPGADVARADFVERGVARLRAMDANGDGVVTLDERRAAMQAARAQRTAARFERLDADKDGAISRAEFEAGHERGGPRGQGADRGPRAGHRSGHHARMGGPRGPQADRRADRQGGPRADQPVTIADVATRLGERFDRLDKDGDGVLTAAERRAAWSEGRGQRRERHDQRRVSPSAPASE